MFVTSSENKVLAGDHTVLLNFSPAVQTERALRPRSVPVLNGSAVAASGNLSGPSVFSDDQNIPLLSKNTEKKLAVLNEQLRGAVHEEKS